MALTSIQLKKRLDDKFSDEKWITRYNREEDKYRVELKDSKQGVSITLPAVIAKYEKRGDQAIDELVYHVTSSLDMMAQKQSLKDREKSIFPVIRSTSFATETNAKTQLIYHEHTAETRIYYALDLGETYQLIDQPMLEEVKWTEDHLKEISQFNLKTLPVTFNEDMVADNAFYFVNANDGYDASRILNKSWLKTFKEEAKGEVVLSVPHQDTLIVADIVNDAGYDIIAQMAMQFFAEGRVPITSLSFVYEDDELKPIFILAKKKPTDKQD
ncbi:Uncharacterized protein YtpQ, UPF0354 family [Pelagirhabdus alkalitolerans]|uniref:Uncharacterized protein YtpQ, UPF0354 family n=1 Tax=Pelagirhabdus alkalitolerans TaxID=1612202 RepID=A0A1G6HI18_9BACI|nr:DUF1444 domain-containing protein [Pelagirhabdus alkalitolerans]SDB93967.1 Uncharacterized protein YtpQ, UPF0354 family [Pelagirhabdus alkalitolerans]